MLLVQDIYERPIERLQVTEEGGEEGSASSIFAYRRRTYSRGGVFTDSKDPMAGKKHCS